MWPIRSQAEKVVTSHMVMGKHGLSNNAISDDF